MKIINKVSWILIMIFLNSCANSNDNTYTNKPQSNPLLKHDFLNISLSDTITINKKDGELCLNENLDSLITKSDLYELRLIDLKNNIELIHWHPFIGNLKVRKVNPSIFEFIGEIRLPEKGNWDKKFQTFKIIKYQVELDKTNYKLSKTNFDIDLKFNSIRLNELKNHLKNNKSCFDQNWEIANNCFEVIEEYEYQLFAALINQKHEFKDEYLSLRKNISIVNAGQFSEYLEGNYLILALLGIITESEYDLSRILYSFIHESANEYCY